MYKLHHDSYCGMSALLLTLTDRGDVRDSAARKIRAARRKGYRVAMLARGRQWEILEPPQASLVPDACGLLTLDHVTFECPECGSAHETRADAADCCAWTDEDCNADCVEA